MAQEDAELIKVRCWLRPPEAGTSMPSGDTVTLSGSHPNADEQGKHRTQEALITGITGREGSY